MLPLLVEGSVKNIHGIKDQKPYVFDFSNRYSVFDWGAMPDQLENKGKALSYMAGLFFDLLARPQIWKKWKPEGMNPQMENLLKVFQENGLKSHFLSFKKLEDQVTSMIEVEPVKVLRPAFVEKNWDYSVYKERPTKTLVPLEFIFRFGMPKGSSLMKRVKDKKYLEELGLHDEPCFGDEFSQPIVEFSTKLEPSDKYLSYTEAREIANLSELEFERILNTVKVVAMRLRDIFQDIDIKLWDGKFEFAFDEMIDGERQFMIVDSIGPDELRLTKNGIPLSKENLRLFYRDGVWHQSVEQAKELASKRKEKDWKRICLEELGQSPSQLEEEFKQHAEGIYTGLANALATKFYDEKPFKNSKTLTEVMNFFKEY